MAMNLFVGSACFSPRVPSQVKQSWLQNGGTVADLRKEGVPAYFFCDGHGDAWYQRLCERSVAVFHWKWISNTVAARFRLPIAKYVINEPLLPHGISAHSDAYNPPMSSLPQDHSGDTTLVTLSSSTNLDDSVHIQALEPYDSAPLDDTSTDMLFESTPRAPRSDDGQHSGTRSYSNESSQVWDALNSGHVVSVSAVLDALQDVPINLATQFLPGTDYMGSLFHCQYKGRSA